MDAKQVAQAIAEFKSAFTTIADVAASLESVGRALRDEAAVDRNVEAVRDQLSARALVGLAKYGTTTERTDLTFAQWLQHAQEEAMDMAVYLERLKSLVFSLRPDGFAVVITRRGSADRVVSCWPTKGAADHDAANWLAPGAKIVVRPLVCIDQIVGGAA